MSQLLAQSLSQADMDTLRRAHWHLEHPSFAARLSNIVGTPIEVALHLLPKPWYRQLHGTTETVVGKLLNTAIATLPRVSSQQSRNGLHYAMAMTTGAMGGLFGLPALLLELPISTAIMLRAIADIAHHSGEDLSDPAVRVACMEVFALGARSNEDDAAETGYYGVRFALAWSMKGALDHVVQHGLTGKTGPLLVTAVTAISGRFGLAVSEKAAAQAIPFIGAAGGAMVNCVFMSHFQDMAWSHFAIRRLERVYGAEFIQSAYEKLSRTEEAEIYLARA